MRGDRTERGQAITLEGFIAAMVVLMAILLALQAVVITPTTGGAVDRTVQSQLQQETRDTLTVASTTNPVFDNIDEDEDEEDENDLSRLLRYFNTSSDEGDFHDAAQSISGEDYRTYNTSQFEDRSITEEDRYFFGEVLNERFTAEGWNYNVEVVYEDDGEFESREIVYQGQPNPNAFTASYTVTLFEDQPLLDADGDAKSTTLGEVDEDGSANYPIPNEADDDDIYHVVELRVVVW